MTNDAELEAQIRARDVQALGTHYLDRRTLLRLLDEARADIERLREALKGLYDDVADYARINNLGGYHNHWMVRARAALSPAPPSETP